ncbi:hypothetical protein L195_g052527, partial [Trifolium pratense]
RNPCEALCMKLFLNVDDTEPSSKIFVCDSCKTFTTFKNLECTCGKPINTQPQNLDSKGQEKDCAKFHYDLYFLKELGYSDLTQLEEITHNIGKQEYASPFRIYQLVLGTLIIH